MPQLPGFLGGTYRSRIHSLRRARTVNLIPTLDEGRPEPIKAVGGFVRSPGLAAFASGLDGAVRGMHVVAGRLFAVAGKKLYEISNKGVATERGDLMADARRAWFADNSNSQLFIQNGSHGYVLALSDNTLTLVTLDTFHDVYAGCVFRDGYIVRAVPGSNQWQFSNLNAAHEWEGINARSRTTDTLQGIGITGTNIWLFGTEFTEARYNNPASSSVWDPIPHGLMAVGLVAPESLASLGQVPYWLGRSDGGLIACRASSDSSFERISTNALEAEWESYAKVDDAWGYAYTAKGGSFYILSFPTAKATFVYDARTGLWHEEGQLYSGGKYEHVEGRCHAYAHGKHLVGSRRTGAIYEIAPDSDTFTGSDPVRWMRLVPASLSAGRRVYHDRLAVECDNPKAHPIDLRYSNDDGQTWTPQRAGTLDEHRVWRRLGQARRGRLYEFSGKTNVRLTRAFINESQ